MARRKTAREMERDAAVAPPSRAVSAPPTFIGEAAAMLVRRGLRPRATRPYLPFPRDFGEDEATRYVHGAMARTLADALVELELARPLADDRYRLIYPRPRLVQHSSGRMAGGLPMMLT